MASETVMSYAEMLLAIVPAAPPTRKNQRATSCPAPISAKVPYFVLSRLIWMAFWCVSSGLVCIGSLLRGAGIRVVSLRAAGVVRTAQYRADSTASTARSPSAATTTPSTANRSSFVAPRTYRA